MQTDSNQLSQLQSLLDLGVITQEEFESAKQRLLDLESDQKSPTSSEEPVNSQPENQNPKNPQVGWWVIIIAVVAMLIVISTLFTHKGGNNNYDSYESSSSQFPEMTEDVDSDVNYDYSEYNVAEPEEGVFIGNPWCKDFFKNEWGEEDVNLPMMYVLLKSAGWNIRIDYVAPTEANRHGVFRFYLLDDDGYLTDCSGPVNIFVRGAGGGTYNVEVTGTRNGITFVEDPSMIEGLKLLFDQGAFDVRMEFDKYNERHSAQARCESFTGSFQEALDRYL